MGSLSKQGLQQAIRNSTQGEGWVDDVQNAMITFLPAEVQFAKAVVTAESDELKKVREQVAAKRAERAAREQSGEYQPRDDNREGDFSNFGGGRDRGSRGGDGGGGGYDSQGDFSNFVI